MSEAVDTVNGRESTYGHPWDDFTTVQAMMRIWRKRQNSCEPDPNSVLDSDYEACVEHVVYMLLVKLVRLSKSPSHRDSIVDLGGYAETLLRCHARAFPQEGEIQMKTFAKVPIDEVRRRVDEMMRTGRVLGDTFIGGPNAKKAAKPRTLTEADVQKLLKEGRAVAVEGRGISAIDRSNKEIMEKATKLPPLEDGQTYTTLTDEEFKQLSESNRLREAANKALDRYGCEPGLAPTPP